jgi:peptide/nickel transport system substrate-binding protein
MPISGRAVMIEIWSDGQSIIVPNPNYWGDDTMVADSVVMVPQADQDTEVASILAGQVDFIYPQFDDSIGAALQDPNIEIASATGGDYEAFYFQQYEGPFADPIFREAFSKSIDREGVFQQIYAPIYAAAGAEGELLNCGPIVQGPYCPDDIFQDTYDPEGAEALLTENGWERNGEGFWAQDGTAPEIRWMINAGNLRRENTQAFLIPRLQEAGFNVVPDNGTAEEVFQQRLPAMDFDMAMYISTAPPDPQYLVPILTCENIPTEENNFQGQNTQGWCNEEATELLNRSDVTPDPEERTQLIQDALRLTETDHVLLPLANYPKAGVWRTDKVGGPIDAELANYRAFENFHLWEDLDGDGQIVIGAEQWPACLNPVTECANSSWMVWTAAFPLYPGVWDTTADGYATTALVTEEPTVETA